MKVLTTIFSFILFPSSLKKYRPRDSNPQKPVSKTGAYAHSARPAGERIKTERMKGKIGLNDPFPLFL